MPDEAKKDKFKLQQNRGAYSEREYSMFEQDASSDIQIKNLDKRTVKKSPDCGSTGR